MTYAIGDRVQRNSATVAIGELPQWNREYPGGRRGTVQEIDKIFYVVPYRVQWDDGEMAYYADKDLLPAVDAAQPSLFGEVAA
jgi:hypothetical protein